VSVAGQFFTLNITHLRPHPCICASLDKPSKLCDTSTLPLFTFRCQAKLPSRCSYKEKLSFKFCPFIGSPLVQLHNLPNTSTWPQATATCQTICPSLYWSNKNIILNTCGFRCTSPAHNHIPSNKSR